MAEALIGPGTCQVRSGTDDPCLKPAAVEILGVPFCEGCAREQWAYFAIGELTRDPDPDERGWWAEVPGDGSLVEALRGLRRGLSRGVARAGELVGSSRR